MAQKFPPPPQLANLDPALNRWLIEIQSILNNSGGIDPSSVQGLSSLETQVTANTAAIALLQSEVDTLNAEVPILQTQVSTNTTNIASLNSTVTTLANRNQVFNGTAAPAGGLGVNGDWYADTSAKHIYVKVGGAWVLIV